MNEIRDSKAYPLENLRDNICKVCKYPKLWDEEHQEADISEKRYCSECPKNYLRRSKEYKWIL